MAWRSKRKGHLDCRGSAPLAMASLTGVCMDSASVLHFRVRLSWGIAPWRRVAARQGRKQVFAFCRF
jgi:hypothetical protein